MYFRVWDLRVGGAKLSTSSASPRVFGVSPRLSASSASLRVFGVSPRLRRLSASSASLRVFGVSPRLRRLCASSASLRVFGVPPRLRRLSASSASLRVFGVSGLLSFGVFGVSDQNSRAAAAITGAFSLLLVSFLGVILCKSSSECKYIRFHLYSVLFLFYQQPFC